MTGASREALLGAYDEHLRTSAEMLGSTSHERLGPLWLARFSDGDLFVTYRSLEGGDIPALVQAIADRIRDDASIGEAEWKTRSHDVAPGLEDALLAAGFQRDAPESVMLGAAEGLLGAVAPAGITVREATDPTDIRRAMAMQDEVFEGSYAARLVPEILARRAAGDPVEVWIAEDGDRVVSAGRIDPVVGTPFAGIWGGATLASHRGRGIYRAVVSARVRSVMDRHGVRYIHSDSTEDSRPILERSGLVKVTTTVPWRFTRVG